MNSEKGFVLDPEQALIELSVMPFIAGFEGSETLLEHYNAALTSMRKQVDKNICMEKKLTDWALRSFLGE